MTDFSECRLIEDELKFYTYNDFCDKREKIRAKFNNLSENGKIFYKYYVYANTHMRLTFKDRIWEYLNGDDLYGFELMRIKRFYKII